MHVSPLVLGTWVVGVRAHLLSPVRLSATPWMGAHQASLSMELYRQEYRSGLLFSTPGDLPDPGIELASPALAGGFFTTEPPGEPLLGTQGDLNITD